MTGEDLALLAAIGIAVAALSPSALDGIWRIGQWRRDRIRRRSRIGLPGDRVVRR